MNFKSIKNYLQCVIIICFCSLENDLKALNQTNQFYCDHCNESIEDYYINYDNKTYHKSCYEEHIQLRCDHCNDPIEGTYNIEKNKNYHKSCFTNNILDRCDACGEPINSDYIVDYYGNKYHQYHTKRFSTCESCSRLICKRITNGGISISGNRKICNMCRKDVVTDKINLNEISEKVRRRLIKLGMNNIPRNIPIILVDDRITLNKLSDMRHGENINGYTRYEYEKLGSRIISKKYQIYVLSSLHKIIFEAVLAHELMHVYLFQNNLFPDSDIREGFCNLGPKIIYENYDNEIAQSKLHAMFNDDDPDYGLGFQKMNIRLQREGWSNLLQYVNKK